MIKIYLLLIWTGLIKFSHKTQKFKYLHSKMFYAMYIKMIFSLCFCLLFELWNHKTDERVYGSYFCSTIICANFMIYICWMSYVMYIKTPKPLTTPSHFCSNLRLSLYTGEKGFVRKCLFTFLHQSYISTCTYFYAN